MCRRAIRGILNDGSDGGDVLQDMLIKPPVAIVVRKLTQDIRINITSCNQLDEIGKAIGFLTSPD